MTDLSEIKAGDVVSYQLEPTDLELIASIRANLRSIVYTMTMLKARNIEIIFQLGTDPKNPNVFEVAKFQALKDLA